MNLFGVPTNYGAVDAPVTPGSGSLAALSSPSSATVSLEAMSAMIAAKIKDGASEGSTEECIREGLLLLQQQGVLFSTPSPPMARRRESNSIINGVTAAAASAGAGVSSDSIAKGRVKDNIEESPFVAEPATVSSTSRRVTRAKKEQIVETS